MRRALLACFVLLAVLLAAAPLPASAAVCVASPDTVTLLPDQDWYFDVSPGGGCVMRLTVTTSNISGVRFDSYGLTIGAPLYGDNNIIDYNVTVLGTSVWIRNRSTQTLDMSIYSLTITRTPSPSPVASYTARPVATLTSPPYITGIAPSPSPLPSATPQFTPTPAPTQIPQGGLCSGSRTGQTCFGGNFADSQYGWSILSSGMGTYVPGIGFVGTQYSGYDLKGIVYYFPVPITIEQFVLQIWDSNAPNCGESSSASVRVNGAWVGLSPAYSTGFNQNGTYIWGTSNNVGYSNVDGIQIAYGRCQSVPGEFLQFAIWYDGVPYSTPTPRQTGLTGAEDYKFRRACWR